jgi:hypothetical protein
MKVAWSLPCLLKILEGPRVDLRIDRQDLHIDARLEVNIIDALEAGYDTYSADFNFIDCLVDLVYCGTKDR